MRKFLLPVINLINLILVSIAWGLSAAKENDSAIIDAAPGQHDVGCGNLYQVVWGGNHANILGIIAFFAFILGCVLMLTAFLPIKARKFIACLEGLSFVGAGVLFILSPKTYDYPIVKAELTGRFIAIIVLILIAGAFSLLMSVIDFTGKKESK